MGKKALMILVMLTLSVTAISVQGQTDQNSDSEIHEYDITVNSLDNGKYSIGLKNNLLLSELDVFFDEIPAGSIPSGPAWKEFEVDKLPASVKVSGEGKEWHKDLVDYVPWAYNQNYKVKDHVITDNGGGEIGLKVKIEYPSKLKSHEKGTLDIRAITRDFGYAKAPDWQSNIQTFGIIRILSDETLREESDYISGFNDKGMYASPVTVGIAAKPLQPFNYWFKYDSLYQDIKRDHPEYIITDDLFDAIKMVIGEFPTSENGEGDTVGDVGGAIGALFKSVELALGVTTGIDLSSAFATWQTEYTVGNAPSDDFSEENDHDCWTYIFGFSANENLCMGANGIRLNFPFSFDTDGDHEIRFHVDTMFEGDIPSLGLKGGRIGEEITLNIKVNSDQNVVGTWSWFNGHTVVFHQDGITDCSYNSAIDNTGRWELTDALSRQYVIHWQVGGWIDQLTLSSDGSSLDGYNQYGTHVTGTKNLM